ncbi:hypothetical protein SO802_022658 [Lithocarpus litseifolius]|uniref:Alcohol dehydrogenase N-terminal domain-containing protein n=1 Tax=Lithocarpus litseifolius TaxID=425828 RepID=A0AAW2C9M0_9ROSI
MRCTSKWLGKTLVGELSDHPNITSSTIVKGAQEKYVVHISRSKAHRAKVCAQDMITGNQAAHFTNIREYCAELLRTNRGSSVLLNVVTVNLPIEEIERPGRTLCPQFQRLYVCLDACKKGFVACRPFIGVDACHLKGHYGGQLMTAVATDPNDQLFPLAFAVVEAETKDSWTWFILKLISDVNAGSQREGASASAGAGAGASASASASTNAHANANAYENQPLQSIIPPHSVASAQTHLGGSANAQSTANATATTSTNVENGQSDPLPRVKKSKKPRRKAIDTPWGKIKPWVSNVPLPEIWDPPPSWKGNSSITKETLMATSQTARYRETFNILGSQESVDAPPSLGEKVGFANLQKRAVALHNFLFLLTGAFGDKYIADLLQHVEVPVPIPKDQLVLKLEATSLNPADWKVQKGKVRPIWPRKFPHIPEGTDVAGEVVEVGPGVKSFKVGDKVVAVISHAHGGGLAEFAVTKERLTASRPAEVSAAEAAALPIAGLTAHQALTQQAGIKLDGTG